MQQSRLSRLLAPRHVALIGDGNWTDAVANGAATIGFRGEVWRVHPHRASTASTHYFRSVDELPEAPDAAFIAVRNSDAPAIAAALAARGAGGFICFSSGFSELGTDSSASMTQQLQDGAGALPFLGPNCYGMVNFFDRVAMWPDQVVGGGLDRGVALISQSGTIALTMMFNERSLPLGYVITIGNQTRLAAEDLIDELCADPRVSAIGVYLEGLKDARKFAAAAARARACGKPIAIVKSGRSDAAARTARSHTGSMTGSDAVFDAFCRQAGIARCDTLSSFCETLKLLHAGGPLRGNRVIVMGASGGDMAMTADLAEPLRLQFPPISASGHAALKPLLSDRITIANPFDIHTYLWFDHAAMHQLFSTVAAEDADAVLFMLDSPPENKGDLAAYTPVIEQFAAATRGSAARAVLLTSLPESVGESVRQRCLEQGVVPLQGQLEGLIALDRAAAVGRAWAGESFPQLELPTHSQSTDADVTAAGTADVVGEAAAKQALAQYGLPVPRSAVVPPSDAGKAAAEIGFPVAIKATGADIAHKSDLGGVILNVSSVTTADAAGARLQALSPQVLVEQMITDAIADVLVGVIADPQFGLVMVIAAGGVHTELWQDRVTLLPPWTREQILAAVQTLKISKLLAGYRGKPAGDIEALLDAITAIGRYAIAHRETLVELDVNPLLVRPLGQGVVAVDAMIRKRRE